VGDAAVSAALAFRHLTLGYDRHPAVHHLDGTVDRGELLAIVGPNGAGKSTLLKAIVGDVPCLEGAIGRGDGALAYLPQADEIDRTFPLSVLDLVAMGLWSRTGPWRSQGSRRAALAAAIETVGLGGFEGRLIGTLSGGQFQRALFARLIVQDAAVILLDEPFRGIDARTTDDLIRLILRWHGEGRTVLAALHDMAQVRAHFPRTLLLAREAVAWGATAAVLTPANLSRAGRLSEAWDETAAVCGRDDGHGHAHDDAQDTEAQGAEAQGAEAHRHDDRIHAGHGHHHHDHAPARKAG